MNQCKLLLTHSVVAWCTTFLHSETVADAMWISIHMDRNTAAKDKGSAGNMN